jgi:DNA-binding CsgD family transcriptional regulator
VWPLSGRELEVLGLLATGSSNQAIAEALVVSLDTVKSHVGHILDKLGVANRTQAVTRAASWDCSSSRRPTGTRQRRQGLLRCAIARHANARRSRIQPYSTSASSANATASRRLVGSSTASS